MISSSYNSVKSYKEWKIHEKEKFMEIFDEEVCLRIVIWRLDYDIIVNPHWARFLIPLLEKFHSIIILWNRTLTQIESQRFEIYSQNIRDSERSLMLRIRSFHNKKLSKIRRPGAEAESNTLFI